MIVYLTPPAHGHVNPVLPVVHELVRRGDEVVCYNNEEFREPFERVGATFRAYPPSELTASNISAALRAGNLANVTILLLRATARLLPFMLEELSGNQPALVVFDSVALWGKMATTQLALRAAASITHLVMDDKHMTSRDKLRMTRLYLPSVPRLLLARHRLIQSHGQTYPRTRPLFPMRDRLNIVFTTRDLQPDTPVIDESFHFVGPSIDANTRAQEMPVDALGAGPVIYISLGTVHADQLDFYRTCFEAFTDFKARFVMAVGKHVSLDSLGSVPANFLVRASVPQLELLQRTDVFITHGGINSVHEALYFGVPQILVPQQFEQLLNARQVAARGAGVVIDARLRGEPIGAAVLREALATTMSDPRFKQAATELRASMRASGGYRQAADLLRAYAHASRL